VQAVYVGDTITCTVTFTEKDEAKRMLSAKVTYVNQDGVEVLTGTFSGFPANVRLAL
jgi:3-hydroxybutyryl-CoA dehydratase